MSVVKFQNEAEFFLKILKKKRKACTLFEYLVINQ